MSVLVSTEPCHRFPPAACCGDKVIAGGGGEGDFPVHPGVNKDDY